MVANIAFPAIDAAGELRVLACLPPRLKFFAPSWRESGLSSGAPLRECDWRPMCGPVLDQDGLGACVGYSGASAFEQAWNSAGFAPMQFSPDFAYACVNGGVDMGAVLSDMVASMASNGMAPAGSVPAYTFKMKQIPQAVRDAAKLHVAAKYLSLSSFDDVCDAVNNGYATSFGISVGGRFTQLDAGGVAGFGFARGGHALHGCGLAKIKAGKYAGQWGLLTKNSWTTDFGDQGYCYLVADHFDRNTDAYAIQAPQNTDPGLINPPSPTLV
jgi:hypothetical protein